MRIMCLVSIHIHSIQIYISIFKYKNNLIEWKLKRKLEIQLSLPRLPTKVSCVYFNGCHTYIHIYLCIHECPTQGGEPFTAPMPIIVATTIISIYTIQCAQCARNAFAGYIVVNNNNMQQQFYIYVIYIWYVYV